MLCDMICLSQDYCRNYCRIIHNTFSFLAVSSLFIGGTGFFKTYVGCIILGVAPSINACIIVFLISFSVYSLDKVADIDKDAVNMPQRQNFLSGRKRLVLAYSLAAYLLAILLILVYNPKAFPIALIPFVANAFYGMKPISKLPRLKDIPVMKNFIVAISWALITTLLPAAQYPALSAVNIVIALYFMLVKTFVVAVLYDIRDVKGDRENGVKTIPVIIGSKKTTFVLLSLNSTLLPLLLFMRGEMVLFTTILILYGYGYIYYFRKRRNPFILDFLVEGEWMLSTVFYIIYIFLSAL